MATYEEPPSVEGAALGYSRRGQGEQLHAVHLLRLPVTVFLRAREHHDDLVRECTLMAIRQAEANAPQLPDALREIVDVLGRRLGARPPRADEETDAAVRRGDATVDLSYAVSPSTVEDLTMVSKLVDRADEFCRAEKLLTLPRDPAVVAFSRWYIDEFVRQIKGLPPIPWAGPLD